MCILVSEDISSVITEDNKIKRTQDKGETLTDKSPKRLIIMSLVRLYNCYILHSFILKHCSHANTSSATPDDDNLLRTLFAEDWIRDDINARAYDGGCGGFEGNSSGRCEHGWIYANEAVFVMNV